MNAPKKIVELVDKFERNIGQYRSSTYNETQVRQEFINPFFEALGWDVYNKKGVSPRFEPVIHEYSLDTGDSKEAPDYAFRIGETVMFFVEAKKPSVNLENQPGPAYQIRKYAYSAKLPLAILTDFEEFIVFNGLIKPTEKDHAKKGRVKYLTYRDYLTRWEEIADVFSRQAIMQGGFDKFAKEYEKVKGQIPVDELFLKDIEDWREKLAKTIAYRNRDSELSKSDLNYAVQSIIDRIVFLRVCEDRGIEEKNALYNIIDAEGIYSKLVFLFTEADAKYNSGLFHFKDEKGRPTVPDTLTPTLNIEDSVLRGIINSLYDGPYAFKVIPPDILGSVYERFLGKEIVLKPKRIVIDDKPINKERGVYYTPKYIVDYIVENTVEKLLEKCKTPKDAAKLKILDPACGSGSFLIGAYQNLIDWHVDWYFKDGVDNHTDKIIPTVGTVGDAPITYRLSNEEKKRILLNNIYGVDIDAQAVEVTKLSLLLKALEGETKESIGSQVKLLKERILPDLGENVKCGNSLIGKDYFDGQLQPDPEEYARINPFDWDGPERGFGEIMEGGGFDAVIGNPPYIKEYTFSRPFRDMKGTKLYKYYQGKMDIWYIFSCLAIDLLKKGGFHSFIATNNWITNFGASKLREKILKENEFDEFVDFGDYKVFTNVGIQTMIYIIQKTGKPNTATTNYRRIDNSKIDKKEAINFIKNEGISDFATSFETHIKPETGNTVFTFIEKRYLNILGKMDKNGIGKLTADEVAQGIVTPQDNVINKHLNILKIEGLKTGDGIFIVNDEERENLNLTETEMELIRPLYTTDELLTYYGKPGNRLWVIYTDTKIIKQINKFPNIKAHLDKFKPVITSDNKPYGLHRARDERIFLGEKISALRKTDKPRFTYTEHPCYVLQTFNNIKSNRFNIKYLTGLFNSNLSYFWFDNKGKKQGNNLQIDKAPLMQFPIRTIDFSDTADAEKHDDIVTLVEAILELNKRLQAANTPREKESLKQRIADTDRQIDALVYELYDLTDEEIKVVEGG